MRTEPGGEGGRERGGEETDYSGGMQVVGREAAGRERKRDGECRNGIGKGLLCVCVLLVGSGEGRNFVLYLIWPSVFPVLVIPYRYDFPSIEVTCVSTTLFGCGRVLHSSRGIYEDIIMFLGFFGRPKCSPTQVPDLNTTKGIGIYSPS